MPSFFFWTLILSATGLATFAAETPPYPRALIPGVTVELVAQEPDVCTPTAIAADSKGRIWLLQNNTHFRPKDYNAPPTDRVLILEDFGPDGRARKISTYADGFSDGMGLLLLPDGDVIVSTRSEILRFHDEKGDRRHVERATILKMKTEADYPHNGMSGLALGPDGRVYLGLGENRGKPWLLTGSDGSTASGVDEGGVFRFDPDGNHLQYWAVGMWNPFGLTFDPEGRLFAVDNDPGAGENCRLMQVLRGSDHGYRFRYGGDVNYPLISWQGRWPGTLPPLSLISEGPTGLCWVGDALLYCSWSDFGIQRCRLEHNGAGFRTKPEWIVQGDHRFRPTGMAQMPDGSLVISDWVDSSYPVHGKGRVWRLRGYPTKIVPVEANADETKLKTLLAGKAKPEEAMALLGTKDPYLRHGVVQTLVPSFEKLLADPQVMADPAKRLDVVLIARRSPSPRRTTHLKEWLQDADPMIRREALQWIAEEHLSDYAQQLDLALKGNVPRMLFDAYVAALDQFAVNDARAERKAAASARDLKILSILLDEKRDLALRALALRMLPAHHPELTAHRLGQWALTQPTPLGTDATRVLAMRSDAAAQAQLCGIANQSLPPQLRADAVAGLVYSAGTSESTRTTLHNLTADGVPEVAREALRSLGLLATAEEKSKFSAEPPSAGVPDAKILEAHGDPAAGRRFFFHPNGPGCFNCHQISGQGRAIGPDLTHLGAFTAAQLLTAIREPSKDIAPAFLYWHVKTLEGAEGYGVDISRNDTGKFYLIDPTGKITPYRHDQVAERTALPVSMMPPGLVDRFSVREVADLLAFLREERE
jgi:putative membrane-bound dehydrogenase-like protein